MLLRSINLLALGVGVVWAQQAPLGNSRGSCLSSSNANRYTAHAACCPTGATEGKSTFEGVVFTYLCNKYAKPSDDIGKDAPSPRDCARLCAQESTCIAASWSGMDARCYMTREGSSFVPKYGPQFVLLAKTEEKPPDDPCLAGPAAVAQCNNEKDAIRREMTKQCEGEVQGQKAAHQDALMQAEDRYRGEKAQCEADKSRQVAAAREQCDSDKAALVRDREVCESEKGELNKQSAAAEKKCKSEVADLQKQVKDLEDKVRDGSGSGSGTAYK
ncbi:hypothetical protein K4K59_008187 [Colletotrichum sp. SAR11_240]|nr:hypothetical protein K4K59_008187 [Colletotrichum sp. SAR11_240]